mgnify:FL=1
MSGFEAINEVTELTENLTDVVKDVAENVGDFARDAMEHFNEQGIKDLQEGNLDGAIDNSDLASSDKEGLKEVAETFDLEKKSLFTAGAKVIGGALGTIAALATPGFQVAGVAAAATCFDGMSEFKKAWDQNQEAKVAALYGYSANATM